MVLVDFLCHYPPYASGERAAFRPDKAQQLVNQGVARLAEAPAPSSDNEESSERPTVREGLPPNWRELTPNRQRAIALRLGCPKTYGQTAIVEYLEAMEKRS